MFGALRDTRSCFIWCASWISNRPRTGNNTIYLVDYYARGTYEVRCVPTIRLWFDMWATFFASCSARPSGNYLKPFSWGDDKESELKGKSKKEARKNRQREERSLPAPPVPQVRGSKRPHSKSVIERNPKRETSFQDWPMISSTLTALLPLTRSRLPAKRGKKWLRTRERRTTNEAEQRKNYAHASFKPLWQLDLGHQYLLYKSRSLNPRLRLPLKNHQSMFRCWMSHDA